METDYIRLAHMVKNLLHIIRWPNLLMLAGIQSLVYFRLLDPQQTSLRIPLFIILALITIILGAGGYVINDYYDVNIDKVNKPDQVIVGSIWSLTKVKMIYFILVGLGAILSIYLALQLDLLAYLFIYPLAVLGLWYYSFALKCKSIIGNLWVSLFCAGVVGVVALPDFFHHQAHHIRIQLWYYMAFAFLSTWYREVMKDIEDKDGDQQATCNTFVVKFGLIAGKILATFLGLSLLVSLLVWENNQVGLWIKSWMYILQGLTIVSMAFMWWAKNNTYYHHASNVIKLVMVIGTAVLLYP